jgi:ABC-type bacteriocin/lantibiotic exporter with double-glycine peptidase domain
MNMLEKMAHSYSSVYAKTSQCSRKFKYIAVPIITAFVVFFLLRSKYLIDIKKQTTQSFVPAFVIIMSMLASIFWIVDIMRYSVFDIGVLKNMDTMLQAIPSEPRHVMNQRPPENSIIGLQNVSFAYGKTSVLLHDKTIHFETGKSTALVGPIGKGKSTIVKLLLGFHVPKKGDCYIAGKWYSELSIETIRNMIGYVPQNPVLFNNTVLYNIRYGNDVTIERVIQVMNDLKLPESFLYRNVGKNGMNLSGGQRQLVWCLRIYFKNPDIILMDEPTASMDNESKDILLQLLTRLMNEKTVILVSHDPYMLNYVDNKVHI